MRNLLILGLLAISSLAMAQSNSAALVKLQKVIAEWLAIGGSIALGIAAGMWVIGDLAKVKFLQHIVDEYKRAIIFMMIIGALALIFDKEIATVTAKMIKPF